MTDMLFQMLPALPVLIAASVLGALLRWGITVLFRRLSTARAVSGGSTATGSGSSSDTGSGSALRSALSDPVLASNLLSMFIAGAVIPALASLASVAAADWRILILAGFCGGLSTFSSLSLQLAESLLRGERLKALLAALLNLLGGLAALATGLAAGTGIVALFG